MCQPAIWRGVEHEVCVQLQGGVVAAATLILSIAVVFKGRPRQKLFAVLLALLPGIILAGLFYNAFKVSR